jgi:predicted RNA-binding Zn ribbon-like protein
MAESRPAPFFIGDDRALDFLNSVAAPWGEEIEWLGTGDDLLAWLEQARVLPAVAGQHFRAQASSLSLDGVASEARELREWFRDFVRHHAGKPLGKTALRELAPLNRLLEQDETYRQIAMAPRMDEGGGDGNRMLRWRAGRHWHSPKALLFPIAEAIGDLICGADFTLLRKCEGPSCTLWFLDVSKNHGRRWCSMAVCGNRAKAAAHRARVRQHSTEKAG